MSLFDHLMLLDKVELAKQLAQQAKENATLKERVKRLEVELFWHRDSLTATPPSLQQAFDTIDAQRMRRRERVLASAGRHGPERRAVDVPPEPNN